MQVSRLFEDFGAYQHDEALRRQWLSTHRPLVDRVLTHFEKQNWDLFTKDMQHLDADLAIGNLAERFDSLRLVTQGPRPLFTFDHTKFKPLVEQRFALANSISADLTGQLLGSLLESGRLLEWWRQARAVWSSYFQAYPYLQTLLQPLYWKSRSDVIDGYVVCNKGFQPLKDLYISAFETIARLSVIAVGLEAIIFHHALEIPLKARMAVCPSMTSRRSRQPTSVTI